MTAPAIIEDIGILLAELAGLGIAEVDSRYDSKSFGNYYVDLRGSRGAFRITRDRSQYIIDGDDERLRSMGLFRAFDSREQLHDAALQYARTVV
jgi:hypothetical protein